MRGSIADGLAPALKNIKENLKVYPLKLASSPPATEFVNITGKSYNTVAPSDFSYFEALDKIIQREPVEALGGESRGHCSNWHRQRQAVQSGREDEAPADASRGHR